MTRPDFGPIRAVSPDEAEELERAWITGDAKERSAIEVAVELATRKLGINREPLLAPPSGAEADGQIRLGRIAHGTRELGCLGITETELTQHMGVFGRSGSGKSTLALSILTKLIDRQIPFVAFDHKRSARALKAMELPVHVVALGRHIDAAMHFNPLVPFPGVPADAHIGQLVELLCQIFFAGEGVQSLLVRSVTECWREQPNRGPPTLLEVRVHVESMLVTQREALWKQSAMRMLRAVTTGQMGRVFNTRRDANALQELLEHHTILELDGLTANDSALLTAHILRFLTHALLAGAKREQLQLVSLIEEAHHLLGKRDNVRESPLETVLREAREIGLGCIIVDQTIGAISPVALANLFTTVVLNCKHRADSNAAAAALLLKDEQKPLLGMLSVGEAVVRLADRWPHAVRIRIPPLDLPKGMVSDHDITTSFLAGPYSNMTLDKREGVVDPGPSVPDSARSADSTSDGPDRPRTADIPPSPRDDKREHESDSGVVPLVPEMEAVGEVGSEAERLLAESGEARAYLEHVGAVPLLAVTDRYQALGLSRRKGDAIKRFLIDAGLLEAVSVPTGKSKIVLTALTESGKGWLRSRRRQITPYSGGVLHAWWQQEVSRLLREAGWVVDTEVSLLGHAFDVFGRKSGRKLLLEVETGKSDWLSNLAALESVEADVKAVLWLEAKSLLTIRLTLPQEVSLVVPSSIDGWLKRIDGPAIGATKSSRP